LRDRGWCDPPRVVNLVTRRPSSTFLLCCQPSISTLPASFLLFISALRPRPAPPVALAGPQPPSCTAILTPIVGLPWPPGSLYTRSCQWSSSPHPPPNPNSIMGHRCHRQRESATRHRMHPPASVTTSLLRRGLLSTALSPPPCSLSKSELTSVASNPSEKGVM
jgi:hypothetical protein